MASPLDPIRTALAPLVERGVARLDSTLAGPAARAYERGAQRLDSLASMLNSMGGDNDKGTRSRPRTDIRPLTPGELDALDTNNGVATRYLDTLAADSTKRGWTLETEEELDQGALEDHDRDHRTQSKVRQSVRLGAKYGGSLLWVVTEDDIPGAFRLRPDLWLAEPLDLDRIQRVVALVPLGGREFTVDTYEEELESGTWREPSVYNIHPVGSTHITGLRVHASRVIYFHGRQLDPDQRYLSGGKDRSMLQAAWDALRNHTRVQQAGAIMAEELKQDVMKVQGLGSVQSGSFLATLRARLELIARGKSIANMIVLGDGEDFATRALSATGFKDLDGGTKAHLSAVLRMPQRKLFGDSPSGLSTKDDTSKEDWNEEVESFQMEHVGPQVTRYYTIALSAKQGPTNGKLPKSWRMVLGPLGTMSRMEEATYRKTVAETDAILVGANIVPPEHIAESRHGELGWRDELEPLEAVDPGPDDEDSKKPLEGDLDTDLDTGGTDLEAPQEVAKRALNGAQLQALERMALAVGDGSMTPATAKGLIKLGFPDIDEKELAFLDAIEAKEPEPVPPALDPTNPSDTEPKPEDDPANQPQPPGAEPPAAEDEEE